MLLSAFTIFHVVISLIAIAAGIIVVFAMIASKRLDKLTAIFLWTTVLTSATGFLFPFHGFKPSYVVGLISLIVLANRALRAQSEAFCRRLARNLCCDCCRLRCT